MRRRPKPNKEAMQCTFHTNTAFLLNSNFPPKSIWKDINEWIKDKHDKHWKRENDSHVIVTIKVLSSDVGKERTE